MELPAMKETQQGRIADQVTIIGNESNLMALPPGSEPDIIKEQKMDLPATNKSLKKEVPFDFISMKREPSSPSRFPPACLPFACKDPEISNDESDDSQHNVINNETARSTPTEDNLPLDLTTMYHTVSTCLDDCSMSPTLNLDSTSTSGGSFRTPTAPGVSSQMQPPVKGFACEVCGRVFVSANNLVRHKRIYPSPTHVACAECNYVFNLKKDLELHIESHKKEYQCNVCGKEYTKSNYLKEHKRTHSQTPPTCSVCKKTFGSSQYLRTHLKTHCLEQPIYFSCFICKRACKSKQACIRHMSTHTKLYKCAICKKAFSQKYYLKSHLLMHLGKLDHKCDECEMSFNTKVHLSRHKRKHMPPRFACAVCNKTYKAKIDLILHCSICTVKK